MRLPAIKDLSLSVYKTFTRFPFAIVCAIAGTVMAIGCLDVPYTDKMLLNQLWKGIMTMYLGMLAGICCSVFCEKYFFRPVTQYIFNFVIILFLHYYHYYTLPAEIQEKEITRFIILALGGHLALAFAPFLVDNEPNGFWQYNKQLFLRILTAAFYSHVLFLGLALALAAVENLFNIPIDDDNYGKLYIILTGVFNTLFFLSGVPDEIRTLENNNEYPKGLKIFTQFVLLPLIFLYLIILYLYGGKIIITHEWPEGWVAWLINGYAIAGILAFLLVWPLRHNENHQWIKTYSKFFYATLLPLIVLLFFAIGIRVRTYGITEPRYFIIVVAIWLTIMALYFIFSRIKNIKIIPLSLCIVCIIAAYGPISAYEVSEASQSERLMTILEKNSMLNANNKVVVSKKDLSFYDKREISSTVDYLITMHGVHSIQHLFTVDLDSLTKEKNGEYVFKPGKVIELMGFEYTYGNPETAEAEEQLNLSVSTEEIVVTTGYDYMIPFAISNNQPEDSRNRKFMIGEKEFNIKIRENLISFSFDKDSAAELNLTSILEKLENDYGRSYHSIPAQRVIFDLTGDQYQYHFQIRELNANPLTDGKNFKLDFLEGYVLVRRKN